MAVLRIDQCFVCSSSKKPLFMFPTDSARLKTWLVMLDKESLLSERSELYVRRYGRVCGMHFHERSFHSTLKTKLLKFAVPIDIRRNPVPIEHFVSPDSMIVEDHFVSPDSMIVEDHFVSPDSMIVEDSISFECENTVQIDNSAISDSLLGDEPVSSFENEQKIERTPKTKTIAQLRCKISKMRKRLFKPDQSFAQKLRESLEDKQFDFVMTQLRMGRKNPKGRRWTAKEKTFALNIYLQSSSTYRMLRKHIALPSKSTLQRSMAKVAKDDGFCPILLEALKKKVQEMPEEDKICTLVFDEMSIKSSIAYNASLDKIDGFESAETGANSKVATQALVFMIRGVMKNWKQVIAYYFRANTCPEGWFKTTVLHIIRQLISCGLRVTAIVCDQGPINQALFKSLDVTVESPFFFVEEKKIFAMYDMPHLIKSVRNNLKKYDLKFTNLKYNAQRTASWKDIEQFYYMDSAAKYRIAPKITKKHVFATGLSSMKVSLATQIFSHSVAAGLEVCHVRMPNSTALQTAEFVSRMDKIFDTMNSKSLYSPKKYACAVSKDTIHVSKWQKWCKWIEMWNFVGRNGKTVRTPCKKGLILTLNGMIGIWDTLSKDVKYLLTSRFNQDCIENTFSSVRKRGGFRDNPNSLEFRSSIRNVIVHNFMKHTNLKNCEDDLDFNLIELSKKDAESLASFMDDTDVVTELEIDVDEEDVPTITDIEEMVLAYIAGVLIKSLTKKLPCEDCKKLLAGDKTLDAKTLLLYFKEYKDSPHGLYWPKRPFHDYVVQLSTSFHSHIKLLFKKPNIRNNLFAVLEKVPFDFFNHHHQENVKQFIVKSFVTMMVKHTVRVFNDDCSLHDSNRKRLKHVQHL